MTRKTKILGAALAAALAISAIAAAAAWAEAPEFQVEETPATLEAESLEAEEFKVQSGVIKCNAKYSGTMAASPSTSIELEPSYTECKAFGLKATIAVNGCKFKYTRTVASNPPTSFTDIVCEAGKEMTVTATGTTCIIHIPPQELIPHLVYDKAGSGKTRDLKETATEQGIKYTETSGCFSPGTHTDGAWVGTITLKAKNAGGTQQGIWFE